MRHDWMLLGRVSGSQSIRRVFDIQTLSRMDVPVYNFKESELQVAIM